MADSPDPFPYVQECPDCEGLGWESPMEDDHVIHTWGGEAVRSVRRSIRYACNTCQGRGRIIPPEWTQNTP